VVFCRNVLIYLSPEQTRLVLNRIADALPHAATLFVGAAETVWQVSDRFKATHVGDTFVYQRRAVAAAPREQAPRRDAPPILRAGATRTGRKRSKDTARTRSGPAATGESNSAVNPTHGSTADSQSNDQVAMLEKMAQDAVAMGDYDAAVVAFRKCAYLKPHDAVAQLHLGLALEASGDQSSAQRAFAAARRALVEAGPDASPAGLEGYAPSELLRLLESKQ
jgi:chemotaxis protein methyltransferase CheR